MNKIKVGLASYGMSGLVFHAPLLHTHPGFELAAIVERRPKGSQTRYPEVQVFGTYEQLLADNSLELIVVNTPDETHFSLCEQALRAGKHVVVEKPFAMSLAEGEKLIRLAEKQGCIISVFQNRRWDGDYLTVKKVIEQKMLGRLVSFESHFDRYRNHIQTDTWKEKRNRGAEIVFNLGAHMIDQAYDLFGLPGSVSADIGIQRSGGEVDDFYHIIMRYPDVHVTLKASYLVREEGPRYILHGTEGSFLKWGLDPQEADLKVGKTPDRARWGCEEDKYWGTLNTGIGGLHIHGCIETLPGNYLAYYDNIYAVIREGSELIVTPQQSLDVLRLLEAVIESNRTQRAVPLASI